MNYIKENIILLSTMAILFLILAILDGFVNTCIRLSIVVIAGTFIIWLNERVKIK